MRTPAVLTKSSPERWAYESGAFLLGIALVAGQEARQLDWWEVVIALIAVIALSEVALPIIAKHTRTMLDRAGAFFPASVRDSARAAITGIAIGICITAIGIAGYYFGGAEHLSIFGLFTSFAWAVAGSMFLQARQERFRTGRATYESDRLLFAATFFYTLAGGSAYLYLSYLAFVLAAMYLLVMLKALQMQAHLFRLLSYVFSAINLVTLIILILFFTHA